MILYDIKLRVEMYTLVSQEGVGLSEHLYGVLRKQGRASHSFVACLGKLHPSPSERSLCVIFLVGREDEKIVLKSK